MSISPYGSYSSVLYGGGAKTFICTTPAKAVSAGYVCSPDSTDVAASPATTQLLSTLQRDNQDGLPYCLMEECSRGHDHCLIYFAPKETNGRYGEGRSWSWPGCATTGLPRTGSGRCHGAIGVSIRGRVTADPNSSALACSLRQDLRRR